MKYTDLRRPKCPRSEGNIDLFFWHQETPFRSHLKSKGIQPSYKEVLECLGGSLRDQVRTVAIHWLLCKDNAPIPFEKLYHLSYLLDVAPNSFFLCLKVIFTPDFKVIHEKYRVVEKRKQFRRIRSRM